MSALPLVFGWLVLAAGPSPAAGPLPAGSPSALYDLGRLARLRPPGVSAVGFSSRAPLGERDGRSVLAEAAGAGVIQRIWVADAARGPGEKAAGAGRLRVQVDGRTEPALDARLDALFSGKFAQFPAVVNGARPGGWVVYTPIPFRDGCLVTLEGAGGRDYQVEVLKLPSAEGVTSFTPEPPPKAVHDLQLAGALAREPDALFSNEPSYSRERLWRELSIRQQTEDAEYPVDGNDRSTWVFALPPGPRTLRSLDVILHPKTTVNWRSARLRIVWEGDNPSDAAVDVPLGDFFGLPARGLTYRSLLAGENENVWSNRFPMAYERGATLTIDAEGPIKGAIRVRSQRGRTPGAGYLRAASQTGRGGKLEWRTEGGRGHVAGTFLTASGSRERAGALAGSLYLVADDKPLFSRGVPLAQEFDAAWPDVKGRLDMAQTFPLSGFPLFRQEGARWDVAAYRWRLSDPVPFERSAALRIGPDNAAGATPPDDVRVTVFWYSERSGPARAGVSR